MVSLQIERGKDLADETLPTDELGLTELRDRSVVRDQTEWRDPRGLRDRRGQRERRERIEIGVAETGV